MNYLGKSMLATYLNLHTMATEIERLILLKAIKGYSSAKNSQAEAERITDLVEKKNLLIELKVKLEKVFSSLKKDDWTMLAHKYFKVNDKKIENLIPRTYFRRADKAMRSFEKSLEKHGLTETFIKERYFSVYFIKAIYYKAKKDEAMRLKRAEAIKLSKTKLPLAVNI